MTVLVILILAHKLHTELKSIPSSVSKIRL